MTLLKKTIRSLPDKPGVYQFFDKNNEILYIGKAKSLKKRVSSYFTSLQLPPTGGRAPTRKTTSGKTALLVRKTKNVKFIIVDTELEALLLENTLIKKHQPRYNVQLKDDKTYPWICVKNERFPRVFPTRNIVNDGSEYFGPYASVKMMKTVLDLINHLHKLRTCNLKLSEENIRKKKFNICLEYHIGNCKGPCEDLQTEEDYNQSISEIKEIIKGNISTVTKHLKGLMKKCSNEYEFEKAQLIKEKIKLLEKFRKRSTVVNPRINNVDVFSIVTDDKFGYVNFMKVVNGAIVQAHTIELKKKLDESPEELLSIAITDLRQRFNSDAKEIITNLSPTAPLLMRGAIFTVPKRGDKKKLLVLSERNVKYYRLEKQRSTEKADPKRHAKRILSQMMKDLHLQELPLHIECFDNSNIQGAYPVAAMVVFKSAKPSKRDYRHYNIKTVQGPNDFASMEEVIYRRYKRLLKEGKRLPQLIVVDGGKGQLSSALKSLEKLNIRGEVGIIGIAKKLEELYFPGDPVPLYLDKRSETLKVIQHLRNEAHRFGIGHHRSKRVRETIKSELLEINGIGKNSARVLLRKFQSVKKIREATEEELAKVIGKKRAKIVFDYLNR
ncbi:excinuclease ABC subunit C [bacterium AH-315-M05]|nr:excinuclease ABC subunit C [bacterium AH-315-M05]